MLRRLLLALAIALLAAHAHWYGAWLVDDAGISLAYARNLAGGHGLVIFPGAERVEAYSNPLWVFCASVACLVGVEPERAAKVLGLAAGVGTLVGLARLGDRLTGREERLPVGSIAALLVAAHPPFAIWVASGMETPLFACLTVWSCERLVAAGTDARALRHAGALSFLLCVTRPEGILYVLLAISAKLVLDAPEIVRRPRTLAAPWAGFLVPFAVPLLLYHLWHYHYFAAWVTNTYFVKQFPLSLWERLFGTENRGWQQVFDWARSYRLVALLPLGFGVLVSSGRRDWLFPAASVLSALLFQLDSNGDWMREFRFLSPATPLVHLFVVGGAAALGREIHRSGSRFPVAHVVLGLALAAAAVGLVGPPSVRAAQRFREKPEVSVGDVRLRADHFRRARQALGVEGAVLLDPDLGGTSLHSGMGVVDTEGLSDVALALHAHKQTFVADYVLDEVRPDFAHVYSYWSARTHILEDPRWFRDFVLLRPYRMRDGRMDGGNFVRRSLLQPAPGEVSERGGIVAAFASGLELVEARFDVTALPSGGRTRLALFWRLAHSMDDDPRLVVRLTSPGAASIVLDHAPFHGWVSVRHWRAGEIWKEVLDVRLPSAPGAGSYKLAVRLADPMGRNEEPPSRVDATRLPTLGVGREDARRAADALLREADARRTAGAMQEAAELLRRAASTSPGDQRLSELTAAAVSAWRDDALRGVEFDVANGNLAQAASGFRAAYWRWPGDERVRTWGERLGEEALAQARESDASRQLAAAFESYIAAVTFDPRLSAARRRAEALRLRRDPPRAVPGTTDPEWVTAVEVGMPSPDDRSIGSGPVVRGASVVCRVAWARTERHAATWNWYAPDGELRFSQSLMVNAGTPSSWARVKALEESGGWVIEVRVGDLAVATRRFTVQH